MERFLDYVIRQLIEFPDEMVITKEEAPKKIVFRLRLAKSDVGKIVGKGGSTIQAIRNLLSVAASKQGIRAYVEIEE